MLGCICKYCGKEWGGIPFHTCIEMHSPSERADRLHERVLRLEEGVFNIPKGFKLVKIIPEPQEKE